MSSRGGCRRGTQGKSSHSDCHRGEEVRCCCRIHHHRECSSDLVSAGVEAVAGSNRATDIVGVDWRYRDRRCTDWWSVREQIRMHHKHLAVSTGLGTAGGSELSDTMIHPPYDRNFVGALRVARTKDTAMTQARRHNEAVSCIVCTARGTDYWVLVLVVVEQSSKLSCRQPLTEYG